MVSRAPLWLWTGLLNSKHSVYTVSQKPCHLTFVLIHVFAKYCPEIFIKISPHYFSRWIGFLNKFQINNSRLNFMQNSPLWSSEPFSAGPCLKQSWEANDPLQNPWSVGEGILPLYFPPTRPALCLKYKSWQYTIQPIGAAAAYPPCLYSV